MSLAELLGFRRRVPVRFRTTVADPIEGDRARGRALTRGEITLAGETLYLRGADWTMAGASDRFRTHVHGFYWLRDMAGVLPPDRGGEFVRPIISGWLAAHGDPDADAWRADRIGARLAFWALYAPYILGTNDTDYRSAVLSHYVRAATHAERNMAKAPPGLPRIVAASGLVIAGLLLERNEKRLAQAETLLDGALGSVVLQHGLPSSRAPADLMAVMEWLHVLRTAYEARGEEWPEAQQGADSRARAGLRAARLGDGRLSAMHGGDNYAPALIDHYLAWPGRAARGLGAGAESGLQRLESGRTVVTVDAAPPPDSDINDHGHAGALAFEFSDGEERIVTNVGGAPRDSRLTQAVRTTAAHSTLTVDDINQSELRDGEPLGSGVDTVEVSRRESEEGQWLDMTHDGYRKRLGLMHGRRLFLAAGGTDLRGEDRLEPVQRKGRQEYPFALRFHLVPGTDVAPTADGRGAVVKTAQGKMWQLKVSAGNLTVDASLWIDEEGRAKPSRQLVVTGETSADGATLRWRFNKVR